MFSRLSDRSRQRLKTVITILATALVIAPATAFATHSFDDVTDSAFYHAAVDWMKGNGVTVGCNPPDNTEYCPDQSVTRGEMAVFLQRLDTENVFLRPGEKATDADAVDGFDANSLVRAAGSSSDMPTVTSGTIESVDVTAPTDGLLMIDGTISASDSNFFFCDIHVDGAQAPSTNYSISAVSEGHEVPCPTSMTVPVTAGTHTIDLVVGHVDDRVYESSLSVLFVPFGGDGNQPTP